MKYRFFILPILLLMTSCIEDLSEYNYRQANEVTYLSVIEGFTFTSGEEVTITAPLEFANPFENEAEIDTKFEINWYINQELIATGYKIKYTFTKVGGFSLILKTTNKETGEIYLSETYTIQSKSAIGWGWMLLCDYGEGDSSLSFIAPQSMFPSHRLEDVFDLPDGIGKGPKSLHYYYVLGSIPDNYVSGLPKIIVNQESGTVTLDGRNLLQDKWMADEFQSGSEPEADFTMTGFAWKRNYYLICTEDGNVYVRAMPRSFEEIPFYGTYSSMPYSFEGGAEISYFQGFQNVTYWTANEETVLMYDRLNSRFLAFVAGDYGDTYEAYSPKVVYLSYYDSEGTFDPSVPKVNDLGKGTECLAAGAYEVVGSDDSGYGGLVFYPKYVALMDIGGTGNYQVYEFTVNPMDSKNHIITENTMTAFSGASLINENSIIRMSSNFDKNPYFYFTDGGNNLYVYSMATKSHALAYTADSRITHLCNSPIVCEFKNYGGNSEAVNWRMAVAQDNGVVSIIDVATSKMIKVFEGGAPDLEIKSLSGFGDIKDIVWATNYEGEY